VLGSQRIIGYVAMADYSSWEIAMADYSSWEIAMAVLIGCFFLIYEYKLVLKSCMIIRPVLVRYHLVVFFYFPVINIGGTFFVLPLSISITVPIKYIWYTNTFF
jgi:hypothetical protein